jgi:hypothetical protein
MTELERQQQLLAALLSRDARHLPAGALRPLSHSISRGLQAYEANAGASAERALAGTFPTVQALVGDESFAALARALWQSHPPRRGDLACFGETLPGFIAASEQLADVPYLADVARLEWQLAQAERAADVALDAPSLAALSELDPAVLHLDLAPCVALVDSPHAIVSVWQAHRPGDDLPRRQADARAALARGDAEPALVWRAGWRAAVRTVDGAWARWTGALLRGDTLAEAFDAAGDDFSFEPWLAEALRNGWAWRVRRAA